MNTAVITGVVSPRGGPFRRHRPRPRFPFEPARSGHRSEEGRSRSLVDRSPVAASPRRLQDQSRARKHGATSMTVSAMVAEGGGVTSYDDPSTARDAVGTTWVRVTEVVRKAQSAFRDDKRASLS